MNRILRCLGVILTVVGFGHRAQADKSTASPAEMLREFYAWYIPAETSDSAVGWDRKAMRAYATKRLLAEIARLQKIEGGIEADPFLAAQDSDPDWAKHIRVRDVEVTGEKATAEVSFTGKSIASHKLKVRLALEDGAWRIDGTAPLD